MLVPCLTTEFASAIVTGRIAIEESDEGKLRGLKVIGEKLVPVKWHILKLLRKARCQSPRFIVSTLKKSPPNERNLMPRVRR